MLYPLNDHPKEKPIQPCLAIWFAVYAQTKVDTDGRRKSSNFIEEKLELFVQAKSFIYLYDAGIPEIFLSNRTDLSSGAR